jgi:phosphate:Na+ symporter
MTVHCNNGLSSGHGIISLVSGLIAGLGLFLMGIKMMSDSMTLSTGDQIRKLLARLTHNRMTAFLTGIITTMVFQSSTATSVMLISFVNSRLMKFANTIGVILGAAIGATVTIQLIAFRLTDYSLTILSVGFVMYIISSKPALRSMSLMILGFGILFMGLDMMSGSIEPLKQSSFFTRILSQMENPILGLLAGAAITALIQSTSAFMGILIVLGNQGLLSLDASIPLLLGSNIGTSVTAFIAAAGGSGEAKQVALAHTLFKVTGTLLIIAFIPWFANLIEKITISNLPAREIANSHTVFNVAVAFIFLPFTVLLARLVTWLMPAKADKHKTPSSWYIDDDLLRSPSLALSLTRQEILRMMEIAQRMTEEIIVPFMERKATITAKIKEREKELNYLRDEINKYLVKIIRQNISSAEIQEAYEMMYAVDEFEQIGDVISVNLVDKAEKWCNNNYHFSEEGRSEILDFHQKTMKLLYQAYSTFSERNKTEAVKGAKRSKSSYSTFRKEYFELEKQHYNRLKMEIEESVESSRTHMEIIGSLKVIGSHATNIARIILKENHDTGQSPDRIQLEGSAER